ncbi:MAG TPA: YceI family protein [Longimicrobiaceae bacterium]|nr:YceI family protein [Longimicrobiaceae bacterium]
MRTHLLAGALLFTLAAPAARAGTGPVEGLTVQPSSRLWVEGTSSVRSFKCTAKQFDAAIDAEDDAKTAVLAGTKAVRAVSVRVPVRSLDCGNGTMNEHMLKAIKAKENPEIAFQLISYELVRQGEAESLKMTGTLSLGGAQRPVTLTGDVRSADGALAVTGATVIKLSEYGLKAPSLMMGAMKVGDQVTVRYDLSLK